MKRLAQFLSTLFPAWWRTRYGAEFEALLEDTKLGPRDLADILKGAILMQLSKTVAFFAIGGLALGIAATFILPRQYIWIMTLQTSASAAEIHSIADAALTRRALGEVVQKQQLFESDQGKFPLEDLVVRLKKKISINPGGTDAFRIVCESEFPEQAKRVMLDLTRRLLDENLLRHGPVVSVSGFPELDDVGPNRTVLTIGGLVAGLLAGFAATWFRRGKPRLI